MAGDALNDPNFAARLKLSEDPEKAKERAGMAGDYDVSGYSDKEISMALQGDTFDDTDYARLTGGQPTTETTDPVENVIEDTAEPTDQAKPEVNIDFGGGSNPFIPEIAAPGVGGGYGGQTVFQDNDQQSSVVGDNNTVTQNQDNSISNGSYAKRGQLFKDSFMNSYFS